MPFNFGPSFSNSFSCEVKVGQSVKRQELTVKEHKTWKKSFCTTGTSAFCAACNKLRVWFRTDSWNISSNLTRFSSTERPRGACLAGYGASKVT
jgi:hypothetical protein